MNGGAGVSVNRSERRGTRGSRGEVLVGGGGREEAGDRLNCGL